MNERIRELSDQADAFARETVAYYRNEHDEYPHKLYEVSREKFAELIVQEMLRLLAQYSQDSFPEGIVDDFDEGYLAGLYTAHRAVKNHFGVEQ